MIVQDLGVREFEVLQGISDGFTNIEIGRLLFITENTVRTHRQHISRKLSANNAAHAVSIGFRIGLLGVGCMCRELRSA